MSGVNKDWVCRSGLFVVLSLGLVLSAGCASQPIMAEEEPVDAATVLEAAWIFQARPDFVTIQRETMVGVVRDAESDLIVIETEHPHGGHAGYAPERDGRVVWLVEAPAHVPLGQAIAVGGEAAEGWLLEERPDHPLGVVPLRGTLTVLERGPEGAVAEVNVVGVVERPAVGQITPRVHTFAARLKLPRFVPPDVSFVEMNFAGGAPPPDAPKPRPLWWALFDYSMFEEPPENRFGY